MSNANEPGPVMADIRVLHGHPTHDEVAALVVALTPVSTAQEDVVRDGQPAVPAWTRAALLEGIGEAPVSAPGELVPY